MRNKIYPVIILLSFFHLTLVVFKLLLLIKFFKPYLDLLNDKDHFKMMTDYNLFSIETD